MKSTKERTKAVIYCRVSSKKQSAEGGGLDSQEHRCKEYAEQKGYQVDAVFPDDVSGGGDFMNRPGMVALLAYLDAKPDENYVVIFDDLKRYARDTEFHLKLRRIMAERGATRECLNFNFEDTPEGKFIETMLAAQGELEREQNGRQVIQKMKARLQQGFWVFWAPVGYRYEKSKRGGKELVLNEPLASIVREALEGYAMGRFESQAEVKRFLNDHPGFPNPKNGEVTQQRVTEILTNPVYAGILNHERWGVHNVTGNHEPLISLECFDKIQRNRAGVAKAPIRKNLNLDFPIRGFVLCDDCQKPLTSCWSKGSHKKYPYYLCDTKGCPSYRKSVLKEKIEGEFEDIIRSLQPAPHAVDLTKTLFRTAWDQRMVHAQTRLQMVKDKVASIGEEVETLLDRVVNASGDSVIRAYERKIESLEHERRIATEKLKTEGQPLVTYQELIERPLQLILNPWNIWASGHYHLKRIILRLAFSERITYNRFEGYRTPKTTIPFKVLGDFDKQKREMVIPIGLEPITSRLGILRSILMSYGTTQKLIREIARN